MLKDRVYNKPTHRNTLEGILYRMRTGCPWRDVPESFGDWSTIYRRFNLWSKNGVLMRVFSALRYEPDLEWEFIDASTVKAHQHNTGARTEDNEGIGKSAPKINRGNFIFKHYQQLVGFKVLIILSILNRMPLMGAPLLNGRINNNFQRVSQVSSS